MPFYKVDQANVQEDDITHTSHHVNRRFEKS